MNKELERIYAGFIGMNAGIRLGAPVEPQAWDVDTIQRFYGNISGYVKDYKNFAADDDVNGPVYFLRGLLDSGINNELTPQAVGEAWLNYARDGIGLYWWGGDGISTEHTAYNNLKKGIHAPQSGSIEQNGVVLAEQIGGQIFIDTWGLISLGDPHRAAKMATAAASVSHDGNGVYGGAFLAACIAAAYVAESIDEILDAGLREIPAESTYACVVRAVRNFHAAHPQNWRACMQYLIENWGYDKYTGVCHIIPNAGVCILAMLYGEGDFNRTIEIATMCGWDTDCNAGNVGTILGVYCGLDGIAQNYRRPMNDFIVLSGISGYLNNLDMATYAKFLYQLARVTRGENMDNSVKLPQGGEILMDFALPGSTHGLRLSNHLRFMGHPVSDGMEIVIDRILPEDSCDVFYKPFYRRSDFDDERYKPVFSPTVFSGQIFRCSFTTEIIIPGDIYVCPYVLTAMQRKRIDGNKQWVAHGKETQIVFSIPDTQGDYIAEVGFHIETVATSRTMAVLKMQDFSITGKGNYSISTALCETEFLQQTPFALNRGRWFKDGQTLRCITEEKAQAYTGNYYATDVEITSIITAEKGSCLMARATGARCHLVAGFLENGQIGLRNYDRGVPTDIVVDFSWKKGENYLLQLKVEGNMATLFVDGNPILSRTISMAPNGMVGFAQECAGEAGFCDLKVVEFGDFVPLIPQ